MPITDDQIDPELLHEANPTMEFFRQNCTSEPSFLASNPGNNDVDDGQSDDDIPSGIAAASNSGETRAITSAADTQAGPLWQQNPNLIAFGQALKCVKKLESRSEAELDKYCAVCIFSTLVSKPYCPRLDC